MIPVRDTLRRRGSVTFEWILLFVLIFIGALAGFMALSYAVSGQQGALGVSVEGMNFPPPTAGPVAISSSASITAAPMP